MHQITKKQKTGAVLIMMLGLLSILVIFVFKFLEYTHQEIRHYAQSGRDQTLRNWAYSALDTSIAAMHEIRTIESTLKSPAQGWADPWKYAKIESPDGLTIKVSVKEESGKISLEQANFELLRFFFEEIDIPLEATDSLADALLDWMDADDERRFNGAEINEYADLDTPYKPANALPTNYQEILLVEGFDEWFLDETGLPNDRFQKFKDSFSIYSFTKSNVNTLSSSLTSTLERLYNFDQIGWEQIVNGFDGEPNSDDDQTITQEQLTQLFNTSDLPADLIGTEAQVFHLKVLVSRADMNFNIDCVFTFANDNAAGELSYPVKILRMSENYTP